MIVFALHYSIFSFVACCGGLQIAAWYNHLDGLLLVVALERVQAEEQLPLEARVAQGQVAFTHEGERPSSDEV